MATELSNASGARQAFSQTGWALYLTLAERYGWRPAGTLPPSGIDATAWDGAYDANAGQSVTHADAVAFGLALERAVKDPELPSAMADIARLLSDAVSRAVGLPSYAVRPPSDLAPLRALADFAKLGAFRID